MADKIQLPTSIVPLVATFATFSIMYGVVMTSGSGSEAFQFIHSSFINLTTNDCPLPDLSIFYADDSSESTGNQQSNAFTKCSRIAEDQELFLTNVCTELFKQYIKRCDTKKIYGYDILADKLSPEALRGAIDFQHTSICHYVEVLQQAEVQFMKSQECSNYCEPQVSVSKLSAALCKLLVSVSCQMSKKGTCPTPVNITLKEGTVPGIGGTSNSKTFKSEDYDQGTGRISNPKIIPEDHSPPTVNSTLKPNTNSVNQTTPQGRDIEAKQEAVNEVQKPTSTDALPSKSDTSSGDQTTHEKNDSQANQGIPSKDEKLPPIGETPSEVEKLPPTGDAASNPDKNSGGHVEGDDGKANQKTTAEGLITPSADGMAKEPDTNPENKSISLVNGGLTSNSPNPQSDENKPEKPTETQTPPSDTGSIVGPGTGNQDFHQADNEPGSISGHQNQILGDGVTSKPDTYNDNFKSPQDGSIVKPETTPGNQNPPPLGDVNSISGSEISPTKNENYPEWSETNLDNHYPDQESQPKGDQPKYGNDKPLDQTKTSGNAPSSGHFFAYFLTAVVICISGYVIFHNKQKILAFIVEGRDAASGGRRRTNNGVQYSQLKSNVEEVMPSLDKATSVKNFVY